MRALDFARASDTTIFSAARDKARLLITKDRDFAELVARLGPPPAIILLTCGNTSTDHVKNVLRMELLQALALINGGEPLVEIGGS